MLRKLLTILLIYSVSTTVYSASKNAWRYKHYQTVEWTDLIPPAELEILKNPPAAILNIPEGSDEDLDIVSGNILSALQQSVDPAYQQALSSTNIMPEYNNRAIKIPGFIVPIEFDDNQVVTEFFLVPYFGACIHVPPPPPNQIIYVKYPQGFKLKAMEYPFWLRGTLKTSITENDLATSAYSMVVDKIEDYR